jgi:hypothetical protein
MRSVPYYEDFRQLTDHDVVQLITAAGAASGTRAEPNTAPDCVVLTSRLA